MSRFLKKIDLEAGVFVTIVLSFILFFVSLTLDYFAKDCLYRNENKCTTGDETQQRYYRASSIIMVLALVLLTISLIVYIYNCSCNKNNSEGNSFGKSFGENDSDFGSGFSINSGDTGFTDY